MMGLKSLFGMRRWVRPRVRSIGASEGGASAIEFALLLPLLVVGCMVTVDLGMALYQKMSIDQSIRAGAEGLMVGRYDRQLNPKDAVKKLAETIAEKSSSAHGDGTIDVNQNKLVVNVEEFCLCPEDLANKDSTCTKVCNNSVKRYKFYHISGTQQYKPMYLPTPISLSGAMLVQVE